MNEYVFVTDTSAPEPERQLQLDKIW